MNELLGKVRPNRWASKRSLLLLVLALTTASAAQAGEIAREFSWESYGKAQTLTLKLPEELIDHYADKPRTYAYDAYVHEDAGFPLRKPLADAFEKRAREEGMSEWQKINMVIDFVQSLEYQTEVGEYPKYPAETLDDGGGDCEDTSILLAAILDEMGVECVMLSPPGHMAVGVAITGISGKHYVIAGTAYFYVETTGENWAVGDIPPAYSGDAKVYQLHAANAPRHIVAAEEEVESAPMATVTTLTFALSRSPLTEDYTTKAPRYRYRVLLSAEDNILSEVKEVQYRPLFTEAAEPGHVPWMRAYSRESNFMQSWVGREFVPIQVRIFFEDGSYKLMEITMSDLFPRR